MSSRDIATISEELSDLRSYIHGLPKRLVESGAFVGYQNREALLQEELIAAQLYEVAGVPQSARPDQSQGLRLQSKGIFDKLNEFQEKLKRRVQLGKIFELGLPAIAAVASVGAAVFIWGASDLHAYIACGITILTSLLSAFLDLGERVAEKKQLSHHLELIKLQLKNYETLDSLDDDSVKLYREKLLEFIKELPLEEAQPTSR